MRQKIGRLECLKRNGENERDVIVLLHGFGADANDLFPLAELLDFDENRTFVCPQAPFEVPIGPGYTGRGWFPISVRDLEAGVDLSRVRPPGLDESAELVSELIFELNPERLVLGGFSQGAMIATEVTLASPGDVDGLMIWSGTLLDEANWSKRAAGLAGKRFLQSHGSSDTVLPYALAQKLHELLKKNGAEGPMLGFGGGHEIPMAVLQKSAEFTRTVFVQGQS